MFPGVDLDLGQYLFVCGFLILLIIGLAWTFRRFVGRAWKSKASQRSLAVLDVLPLGGRAKLCVVRCYDRTFALGLGEKEVSLVAELDAPELDASRGGAIALESAHAEGRELGAVCGEPEGAQDETLRPADRRAFARELLRQHAELVESEIASGLPASRGARPLAKSGVAVSEAERVRAALRRGGGVVG